MDIVPIGFPKPIQTDQLKVGDFFVAYTDGGPVLCLQTDFIVNGEVLVLALSAPDGFQDKEKLPFLLFRDGFGPFVGRITEPVSARPAVDILPFMLETAESPSPGTFAISIAGPMFIRARSGAGGFLWVNLQSGETQGATPQLPFYYRRWRLTVGPDERPTNLVTFGEETG